MSTEDEIKQYKKYKLDDAQLKKRLLEDIEAVGGLAVIGKDKKVTFASLLRHRISFYAKYKKSKLENLLNYWRKLDRSNYLDLLEQFAVTPAPERFVDEADASDEMASTTGGPGGGRRAAARGNNNNNNNAAAAGAGANVQGPVSVQNIGTFQGESCLRFSCLLRIS